MLWFPYFLLMLASVATGIGPSFLQWFLLNLSVALILFVLHLFGKPAAMRAINNPLSPIKRLSEVSFYSASLFGWRAEREYMKKNMFLYYITARLMGMMIWATGILTLFTFAVLPEIIRFFS